MLGKSNRLSDRCDLFSSIPLLGCPVFLFWGGLLSGLFLIWSTFFLVVFFLK